MKTSQGAVDPASQNVNLGRRNDVFEFFQVFFGVVREYSAVAFQAAISPSTAFQPVNEDAMWYYLLNI